MSVPHRDRSGGPAGGSAGYLCVRDSPPGELRGALFVVNEMAEPIEFTFSRVNVPNSFLWREGEARRHASRSLAVALFEATPASPEVIISTPDDVPAVVLVEDLEIDVPVCHLSRGL